jgi:hypothetical protein
MSTARFRPGINVGRESAGSGIELRAPSRRRGQIRPRLKPRMRLALTVWRHGSELDRRLAAGEDPWTSDALAVRARALTGRRSRRRVADGMAGVLRSAQNGDPGFTAAVRPRSEEVLEAADLIGSIERRLRGPGPVGARGVALIRLLLIDGNGPLYRPSRQGALASRLRSAAAALRPAGDGD